MAQKVQEGTTSCDPDWCFEHLPFRRMDPVPAVMVDPTRADHPLAHLISVNLRQEIRKEQNTQGCDRVDMGPFSVGAFSCWKALLRIPVLRIQLGFPKTCSLMHSLQEQAIQIVGCRCLADHQGLMTRLTVQERADATESRSEIMAELSGFPVWIETRADLMSVELKKVLCRYLNALIESVFELQNVLTDPVLACLTRKCAEACLRCKFERSPNSGVEASLTPRSTTSSSAWHDSRAQAYGFGPPRSQPCPHGSTSVPSIDIIMDISYYHHHQDLFFPLSALQLSRATRFVAVRI